MTLLSRTLQEVQGTADNNHQVLEESGLACRDALGLIFGTTGERKEESFLYLSLALSVTLEKSIDLFMFQFLHQR